MATIQGTDESEELIGTKFDDTIFGAGGDDVIQALAGDDSVLGGAGDDSVLAGEGNDTVDGGEGSNVVRTGSGLGDDEVTTGGGDDSIFTGAGDDTVAARRGNDEVRGGSGDDWLDGGAGNDTLYAGSGSDSLIGGPGDDVFYFDSRDYDDFGDGRGDGRGFGDDHDPVYQVNADDVVSGGNGWDKLILRGDYAAGVTFAAATVTGVEEIQLKGAFSYALTTDDATVASGRTLTVDGSAIEGLGRFLHFDGSAETDGRFVLLDRFITDDILRGGAGADAITISGGVDQVFGNGGNDVIGAGASLAATDAVDGGGGYDRLVLDGDYSAGLVLDATTLVDVEQIVLTAGSSYQLTTDDANVAAGQTLVVNATALAAGQTLDFDGTAETDGRFVLLDGAGDGTLRGGAGADVISTSGGDDQVFGNGGNDAIRAGASLTATDAIDGGGGTDSLVLAGDYSAGLVLAGDYSAGLVLDATTLVDVEQIVLIAGFGYGLTTNDANVAAGQLLVVRATTLAAGQTLAFDGSAESDGRFVLRGGAGDDVLRGGANVDVLLAGAGADQLRGGGGPDRLTGGPGDDLFLFHKGEAAGDVIADFVGNGPADGDFLQFVGYAPGTTLTNSGSLWTLAEPGGDTETFRIVGVTSLDPSDYSL